MPDPVPHTDNKSAEALASDLIDRLYAVAMEPERFEELAHFWHERLERAAGTEFANFEMLVPHLVDHVHRADVILSGLSTGTHPLSTSLRAQLDADSHAAIAFEVDGRIAGLNPAAREVFGLSEAQTLADLPLDDADLTVIRTSLARMGDQTNTAEPPVIVRARLADETRQMLFSLAHLRTASNRTLGLLKSAEMVWPDALGDLVMRAFDMTQAEVDVVRRLTQGQTVRTIAAERRSAVKTVRAQLSAIFEKTETQSQTELVRMAMGLTRLDLIGSTDEGDQGAARHSLRTDPPFPRPDDRRMLTLPDGRLLDYADFGDPEGTPVLFFHTEFFGDGWPASMVAHATARGLRIIAPARPGNGRSTPIPEHQPCLALHAQDLVDLLDHLGIASAIHLSQMAGTMFSLQLAQDAPDRLCGMVIIAPIFPFDSGIKGVRPPYFHRLLASALNSQPRVLRYLARAGMAYFNRVGPARFIRTFGKDSASDMALPDDAEKFAAMCHGMQLCGMQGHLGYFNDYRDRLGDPLGIMLNLRVPLKIVVGGDGKPEQHGNLQHVAKNLGSAELRRVNGAGSFLFFSHEREVISALKATDEAAQETQRDTRVRMTNQK